MLTWAWCRNQFRCYSHDTASLWLSRVFLFCITFLALFFPKLSSQIEWCLCLKAMAIDPHWKGDTTWAINTMYFIWGGHMSTTKQTDHAKSPNVTVLKPTAMHFNNFLRTENYPCHQVIHILHDDCRKYDWHIFKIDLNKYKSWKHTDA